MKVAYFDTVAGISGDMTLGAFISAGVGFDDLQQEIAKLHLQGVELEAQHIQRSGITAVKLDVVISIESKHHRHLKDIFKIIDDSSLSEKVKSNAKNIFMTVAQAESKVHNTAIEKVHFHEVGALDSIVDIVGAAICLDLLGIERVYSSPVKLGSGGFVETEHGKLPLPGPATSEILREYPIVLTDIPYELTTPTGAAIVKTMSDGMLSSERISVTSIGYGAGTKEIPQVPNVLRIMIGEMETIYEKDEMVMVETNIDNMNPEIYPYVIEQLMISGAHDAYMIPIIMKKGRPAILLSALVHRGKMDAVIQKMFAQTTTIGVRIIPVERRKLHREQREINTSLGRVKVKIISLNGNERIMPEFEECKRIADTHLIPLIEVYRVIEDEIRLL